MTLACSPTSKQEAPTPTPLHPYAPTPLSVFVVNYPLQYFAERIGGDLVEVSFPAPQDSDPAHWNPEAETVVAYQNADLILLNGAGYAKWVQRVSLPEAKLVDTSAGLSEHLIAIEEGLTHMHGPEGEHVHRGYAFTTWLDPTFAVDQAKAIQAAFSAARPEQTAAFEEGFAALEQELTKLDEAWASVAVAVGDRPVFFSHPVYQYLARRYELNGRALYWEPDAMPTKAMWRDLENVLQDHQATWMLWESSPLPETANRLAAMGVNSVVIKPSGNVPEEGDFRSVMMENASRLQEAVHKKAASSRSEP